MQLRRRARLPVLLAAVIACIWSVELVYILAPAAPSNGAAHQRAGALPRAASAGGELSYERSILHSIALAVTSIDLAADERQATVWPHGPPASLDPVPGESVFHLSIPAIGLDEIVAYGTSQVELARGPGHYPSCYGEFDPPYCAPFKEVWPGEVGRSIVAAHRTLAGADFFDLGNLRYGDTIRVDAAWGRFFYEVERKLVVDPANRSVVLTRVRGRELMLVTCHPKYSAAQRLLIIARLERAERPARGWRKL